MRSCPTCREQFEEEMSFCTFDGTPLRSDGAPKSNGWKAAFFILLFIYMASGGIAFYLLTLQEKRGPAAPRPAPAMAQSMSADVTAVAEKEPEAVPLAEMSRDELMASLPKNLLRRFHAGQPGQGTPDDLRVFSGDDGDYVALVGKGKLDGPPHTPAQRILILRHKENEFRDVTKQVMPAAYQSGAIAGQQADAKFDEGGVTITLRERASLNSILQECASCDHAYQQVTFEWKAKRYVETARVWENDRYTALYAVAEALEKKRVDARARPFIEKALDHTISRGFARSGKEGWTVQWRGDESDLAQYELSNGTDSLLIIVSQIDGQWRVSQIKGDE